MLKSYQAKHNRSSHKYWGQSSETLLRGDHYIITVNPSDPDDGVGLQAFDDMDVGDVLYFSDQKFITGDRGGLN